MMNSALLIFSSMTSLFLFFSKTPLSAGLLLLMQTSILSVLLCLNHPTPWLSILLFLVFVGGLMILLIYTSSISPNIKQKSFPSITPLALPLIASPLFIMSIFFSENMKQESLSFFSMENMLSFQKTSANIINFNSATITILMAIYLLLALIIIVKITNSHISPMRKTN
uniref:NADH-ubiquinone oxidoreductase chain 6 n=1 Tax=Lepidocampa weberi TaxID=165470 RepID=U3KTP8_9HEXA|nr:NADH dehydrogenase subunit 6 [Lepidocampa weberi]AEV44883.1 NADH dehydrogenase subunit 6 [Lepidocampa weberi]